MKLKVDYIISLTLKELNIKHEVEYRFCKARKWRFDFAIPDKKIALEAEGAIYTRGRHTRPMGYSKDCEKYNRAALDGWKVLRYTSINQHQVKNDLLKAITGYLGN